MTFGTQSSLAAILAHVILRLGVLNRGSGVLLDLHQAHPPVPGEWVIRSAPGFTVSAMAPTLFLKYAIHHAYDGVL